MPFELRPYPTPSLRPDGEYLQRAWSQSVYPLAEQMGVAIRLPTVSPQPHTHLAFEGLQFAKEHGEGTAYNSRVVRAFFQEDQDIGDVEVLTRLAGEVGLVAQDFRQALNSRRYQEAHQRALNQASEMNITAIPAFQIGEHLLFGVQPKETLVRAIELAAE